MDKKDMDQDKALIKKAFREHDTQGHKGGKGTVLKLAHGGSTSGIKIRGTGAAIKGTRARGPMG